MYILYVKESSNSVFVRCSSVAMEESNKDSCECVCGVVSVAEAWLTPSCQPECQPFIDLVHKSDGDQLYASSSDADSQVSHTGTRKIDT